MSDSNLTTIVPTVHKCEAVNNQIPPPALNLRENTEPFTKDPRTRVLSTQTASPITQRVICDGIEDTKRAGSLCDDSSNQPVTSNDGSVFSRGLVVPPVWLGRTAYLFRLGFAIAVLLSSLLGLVSCGVSAKEISWRTASGYFEPGLIKQIITENSALTPDDEIINRMQVYQLAEKPRLTFVDFNTDSLCGQMGCLYVIYLESEGKTAKVFSRYLRPELSENVPLLELSERNQNGLPCIALNQSAGSNIHQITLCYDGSTYQNASSRMLAPGFKEGE